jgi:hypothetical protein
MLIGADALLLTAELALRPGRHASKPGFAINRENRAADLIPGRTRSVALSA